MPQTLIENLSHDGRGIAHIEGKTTFIFGALPNETVEYVIEKNHRNYDEAHATQIIEASNDRVIPACPHFSICGGCSLQHLQSDQQIQFKQKHLIEQLQHFGGVQAKEILSPLVGPVWNYRHKARLSVRYVKKKNSVLVGFHERNSRYLADLESCVVLAKPMDELIIPLKNMLTTLSIREEIPQIEVAIDDHQKAALILRHLKPFSDSDKKALSDFAKQYNIFWFLQSGGIDSITPFEHETKHIQYLLKDFNLKINFQPNQFSQVNPHINRMMVARAIELLNPQKDETILDLFCGVGNFTLPLATKAKHVVGVEGDIRSVKTAIENAKLNNLENLSFFTEDLSKTQKLGIWSNKSYDKILLDPPRSGAEILIPIIANMNAKTIVYISCNPATLARDAGILCNKFNYSLEKIGIMNMFPHTSHVESIAVFHK